ncbi:glycosyltransferase family 39 protein [Candidatus Woesearchaeota archaeon]|nr:hypothetical protein [uncultured archaeon]MBS3142092.1 glycosyltransferase family 39 protein [Candidatus Woesearchaeota archaeon]
MDRRVELLSIVVLYLAVLFIWSMPYRADGMPYGEFDATSHFMVADYMTTQDSSYMELPPYIALRYGLDNAFKPHTLWYHPPYHTNFAIMQVLSGDRVLGVYLMNTLLSSSIVLILFFVMRSLYGYWAGILSALLVSFSMRDIMVFLWGQWPERIGQALIPLVLFVYYQYTKSYLEGKEDRRYAYLFGVLLAVNLYMHPVSFFHSIAALVIYTIYLFVKHRKIPWNWKNIGISAAIFIVLLAIFPFQTGNVIASFIGKEQTSATTPDFSRLFYWFKTPSELPGVPASYFSFSLMHGLWTLPFLLLGIIILLIRRQDKDMLLLSWLIGLYLVLHADVIGKGPFIHRSLAASAHIFVPLTVLGALSIASFFKKDVRKYAKIGVIIVFILLALFINGRTGVYGAKDSSGNVVLLGLNDVKQYSHRLNQAQYDAADWMRTNLPQDLNVTNVGVIDLNTARWIAGVSQHINTPYAPKTDNFPAREEFDPYLLMDYSVLPYLVNQETLDLFLGWEHDMLVNDTLIYNENNVRIYAIRPT